ncbi:hypothetical protein LEP1GSC021_3760 [Leptospira noguchii str. 1993005606]|nr:hypothetical protein LEP1GSC021_3760 [Leptospira noguchii str. 1993005606]
MNLSYSSVGTITKLRFVCKMMWELLQITILQMIVGTHTFRKFFLNRTYVKIGFKF